MIVWCSKVKTIVNLLLPREKGPSPFGELGGRGAGHYPRGRVSAHRESGQGIWGYKHATKLYCALFYPEARQAFPVELTSLIVLCALLVLVLLVVAAVYRYYQRRRGIPLGRVGSSDSHDHCTFKYNSKVKQLVAAWCCWVAVSTGSFAPGRGRRRRQRRRDNKTEYTEDKRNRQLDMIRRGRVVLSRASPNSSFVACWLDEETILRNQRGRYCVVRDDESNRTSGKIRGHISFQMY